MSPLSLAMLASSLSVDAFAVALGRGAGLGAPRLSDALRTGLFFGTVEALTILVGWLAGTIVSDYVRAVDHWIALVLLGAVGAHMIFSALRGEDGEEEEKPSRHKSRLILLVTAIGTSIDSMAVGVTMAFLDINILALAGAVGFSTLVMVTAGMMAGRLIGVAFGRFAEIAGGLVLIGFGIAILVSHLMEEGAFAPVV